MELRQYFGLIGKWMWLIVLSVAIAAGSSYFASKAATPLYATKTTLMVGRSIQSLDPTSFDLYSSQQLAYTYTQLANREPVLKGVIDSLGLEMDWQTLAGQVSAALIQNTQLLEITVVDTDPYRAQALADAVAQQLILQTPAASNSGDQEQAAFIEAQIEDLRSKINDAQSEVDRLNQELDAANSARQIQDLQYQVNILDTKIGDWQNTYSQLLLTQQGGNINALSVFEKASLNPWPISPNVRMNVLLAAAIGFLLAVGGALLIEYLDDTIKDSETAARATGLAILGGIPRINGDSYTEKLISVRQPLSPIVEAYRIMRTNLQFSSIDQQSRTLMLTSPNPSEGKSVTLANLGVVMAQSGLKVIIVDTDLRRPVQHRLFSLPNRRGLSDAAIQPNPNICDYLQETAVDNLRLLSSGSLPPNPAELLGSDRMKEIIAGLQDECDLVLFDSPPTLVVADAAILGSRVDGVVLVTDAGRTRTNDARRASNELRQVRAKLLGVVVNRMAPRNQRAYYYHYYYQEDEKRAPKKIRFNGFKGRTSRTARETVPEPSKSETG